MDKRFAPTPSVETGKDTANPAFTGERRPKHVMQPKNPGGTGLADDPDDRGPPALTNFLSPDPPSLSPFIPFSHEEWGKLRADTPLTLSEADLE